MTLDTIVDAGGREVKKSMRFWAGFAEGKIFDDFDPEYGNENDGRAVAIFTTRKCARRHFEDVRRVEVREVAK